MVTWYQLGCAALALAAMIGGAAGALQAFGGMMSDSPAETPQIERTGCLMIIIAIVVFAVAIYALRHA